MHTFYTEEDGQAQERQKEGDDLENLGLDAFEHFPATTAFHISGTDLFYDFGGDDQTSNFPFLSPTAGEGTYQPIAVLGLANQLEERQLRWNENHVHEHFAATNAETCVLKEREEFHYLKMVKMVRSRIWGRLDSLFGAEMSR
ncbi:hypothetical protein Vi05172_g9040 [Venturia inaequalis]|nr:hypothetical protein Vi05172_g9040 [Venturia inaequalis]